MERQKVYVIGYAAKGPGPEGITTESFWNSLVVGHSGITLLEPQSEFTNCKVNFGGQLYPFNLSDVPLKDQKRNHPVTHLSGALGVEALRIAGRLANDGRVAVDLEEERYDIGCVVASATSGIAKIAEIQNTISVLGEDKVGALDNLEVLPERPEIYLCKQLGIQGVNFLPVSACASSGVSLGVATEYLRNGTQVMMLAGGVERPYSSVVQAHFSKSLFTNMGALARLNREINIGSRSMSPYTDPAKASRPFAVNPYGFVLSEGGAILILGSEGYVIKHETPVFAEVRGYAITNDAFHDTLPSGIGAEMAMKRAIQDAGFTPDEIEYVNAHATSTPEGDGKEIGAIRRVFGDYGPKLSITAPKSIHGHLTGAAGGVEGWECVMTINKGVVTPTINQEEGSIAPELDLTPGFAKYRQIRTAISNSFGFGGGNSTIVFVEARLPSWF